MRVALLKIENFRGIKKGLISFKKHTLIIGTNNSGKTTVIEALALLLGRDRLVKELTEHDFYRSNPQPVDRILLVATITDFPDDDPDRSTDWFRDGRAIPKWLDEDSGTIHSLRTEQAWKLCCQIAAQAYFDQDSLTVEMVRYFHDHDNPFDPFAEDAPVVLPFKLIQQLGFYLVRASRTWDKVFSWGSELFRRTVHVAAAQPSEAILTERNRLRTPELPIEEDAQIAPLINNVNIEIARCIPDAPTIQLRLTSTDSRSVMEAVSAHFVVAGGTSVPVARQGSGLISLQGLLLLIELGRTRAATGEGFIMALEEPELHLPPATQLQLVQRVQALSTQTFITSHSPSIAAMADPTSLLILHNEQGILTAEPFLTSILQNNTPNWKRKFYQQSRVEILTALLHPTILIPEGKSDFYLLNTILNPLMLTEGWTTNMSKIFGLEVGIVPTQDAKVAETYDLLIRVHQRICCLVDGDAEGKRYINQLLAQQKPPSFILRWQDGAMIEDIIGWILTADENAVILTLSGMMDPPPQVAGDVVNWLKDHKLDIISYEAVADAIANNVACRVRAAELFSGLALACEGIETQRFLPDENGVLVFQP
jgi:putative ATP-dependent endonuclease of OLD family